VRNRVRGGSALAVCLIVAGACGSNPLPLVGPDAQPGAPDAGSPPPVPDAGRDLTPPPPPPIDARPPLPDLRPPPPFDAAPPVLDATIGLDAGLGACNAVPQLGSQVFFSCSTGVVPTPQGGTVVDGTYVLTAVIFYGGCPPPTPASVAETLIFSGGTFEVVANPSDGEVQRTTGTYTQSGSNFLENDLCPQPGSFVAIFDATPTTFRLFVVDTPTAVAVFTRL
jgi:hypothetical protein